MAAPANLVYVGTYTRSGRSTGIHVLGYDPSSGRLTPVNVAPEVDPSFLTFDSSRLFLFAQAKGSGVTVARWRRSRSIPTMGN